MTDRNVLCRHIRLARNVTGHPFPGCMHSVEKEELSANIVSVCKGIMPELQVFSMADLTPVQRGVFWERHSISERMENSSDANQLLLLHKKRTESITVQDVDHIRIHAETIAGSYEMLLAITSVYDSAIANSISYALHPVYGYMTASPFDSGSGCKVSCMIHLPVLSMMKGIKSLEKELDELGVRILPAYRGKAVSDFGIYILFNKQRMGISLDEAAETLTIAEKTAGIREASAKEKFIPQQYLKVKDCCLRSIGILQQTICISHEEAMQRLQEVWLAADMGWVNYRNADLRRALLMMQPYHIALYAQHEVSEDEERAITIKSILEGTYEREIYT